MPVAGDSGPGLWVPKSRVLSDDIIGASLLKVGGVTSKGGQDIPLKSEWNHHITCVIHDRCLTLCSAINNFFIK